MNIVDKEHIDTSVTFSKLGNGVGLDGDDVFVGKFLGGDVGDDGIGLGFKDVMGNSVHEVGFAQAGISVEEEGIVGSCRGIGDGDACCMG